MTTLFNQDVAEIKVSYSHKVKAANMVKLTCSRDSFDLLKDSWEDQDYCETFKVILLNRASKVIGVKTISTGGITGTVADPKLIFQTALLCHATSIILSHNHPSGNKRPSEADIKLTQRLKNGGLYLEITVLDHIIMAEDDYYSFADEGEM